MTIYVDTDVVKAELAKLQDRLKARPALTPLALDLEISLTHQAIVLAADLDVAPIKEKP